MNGIVDHIRALWAHDKAIDSLKVALALASVVLFCVWEAQEDWLIGLILGVIAAALAETDDRPLGRLRAILVMLACFAIASFSVQMLYPYPWLFAFGLAISTFSFVMIGAFGDRYATIATASMILAIYTMLGLSQHTGAIQPFWKQPALLLSGALWYSIGSLLSSFLFAERPARHALAHVFLALENYLTQKADLLEPVRGRNIDTLRLALASQNGRVVGQLNRTREILILWLRDQPRQSRYLKWYFLAQDIHERASSSHYPYEALAESFARSDILFRCQRLMHLQAAACGRLAHAISSNQFFDYGAAGLQALDELAASLQYVQSTQHETPSDSTLIESLTDLCRNITTIERGLANAANPDTLTDIEDGTLRSANPRTVREMFGRLKLQLTPDSSRFRHGIRLAFALTTGYAALKILNLPQGFWVLLTTVFVCQPNYSGTWRRLGQRISGTLLGLFVATIFISAFPHPYAQLSLLVIAGVAFFGLRAERYMLATACITVLVLVCFNQFGYGYALILPRLLDTVLGSVLAVAAVALILPDWQRHKLNHVMGNSIRLSAIYLQEILRQYASGKRDDLPYRIARRDSHNADAELSTSLSAMLDEPSHVRLAADVSFRFLCVSHTLLGYISALGAHRERIETWRHKTLIEAATTETKTALDEISGALSSKKPCPEIIQKPELNAQLDVIPSDTHGPERRIIRQLALIRKLLPELMELANSIATSK